MSFLHWREEPMEWINFTSTAKAGSKPEIVYLSAVLDMMDSALYDRALAKLRKVHPTAAVISGRDVWTNTEGWRLTYERLLQPVTHAYFISFPDKVIGMGVFQEILFLDQEKRALRLVGTRGSKLRIEDIIEIDVFEDWTPTRFARLRTDFDLAEEERDRQLKPPSKSRKGTQVRAQKLH
jgi:hypothetical protein